MTHRVVVAALLGPAGILLCRRSPASLAYPGSWDFPGGHIEDGESAGDALVRELREELGITIERPRGAPSFRLSRGDGGTASLQLQGWAITGWDGVPSNCAPGEHTEIGWFGIPQALGLDLAHHEYREAIPQLRGA
ncbi:NUDIX domain-containing protein [Arthrobacter sp. KBS0702]|uniref:NUDIX domain-containing protein n=1 Tax=Arthrobacter sp. KBS0702 TaxID=2578107 RepID=UPI00110D36CA|nr:NUDIX domain-containing protein [Arthrobacter sp. KBS0702]QDW28690.1 NUDIX domain-containing protein [Arthrobacter sp. KBS0702]